VLKVQNRSIAIIEFGGNANTASNASDGTVSYTATTINFCHCILNNYEGVAKEQLNIDFNFIFSRGKSL
jgi:hypothetical protein